MKPVETSVTNDTADATSAAWVPEPPYEAPEAYLSHRPPMLLISRVESIAEDAVTSITTLGEGSPLAPFREADGTIGNEWLIELMAQCVGIWAGSVGRASMATLAREHPLADVGLLLSVRQTAFYVTTLPATGELVITMRRLLQDGQLASFEGEVTYAGERVAEGKITVYQPRVDEMAALFGEHSE